MRHLGKKTKGKIDREHLSIKKHISFLNGCFYIMFAML